MAIISRQTAEEEQALAEAEAAAAGHEAYKEDHWTALDGKPQQLRRWFRYLQRQTSRLGSEIYAHISSLNAASLESSLNIV